MASLIHNHNTSNEKSMSHIGQNQLKIGRFVFETDNIKKGADAADDIPGGRRMRHDKGHSCTQNRGRIYSARKYEKGPRFRFGFRFLFGVMVGSTPQLGIFMSMDASHGLGTACLFNGDCSLQ